MLALILLPRGQHDWTSKRFSEAHATSRGPDGSDSPLPWQGPRLPATHMTRKDPPNRQRQRQRGFGPCRERGYSGTSIRCTRIRIILSATLQNFRYSLALNTFTKETETVPRKGMFHGSPISSSPTSLMLPGSLHLKGNLPTKAPLPLATGLIAQQRWEEAEPGGSTSPLQA